MSFATALTAAADGSVEANGLGLLRVDETPFAKTPVRARTFSVFCPLDAGN